MAENAIFSRKIVEGMAGNAIYSRITKERLWAADFFLVFYSVFRSGSAWRSGKSCKYEGRELNGSRKIVVIAFICISLASQACEIQCENSGLQ